MEWNVNKDNSHSCVRISHGLNEFVTELNLVHKFIPMPQAMKIPEAKAAVDQEWEKLEKIPAWNLTKVESKKRCSMKQGRRAQKFMLPH